MQRRAFFRQFLSSLGVTVAAPAASAAKSEVLIQETAIAGFQFHDGESVWASLRVGDELELVREASNPHDAKAVAVHHGAHKLGYVPRGENGSIALMLDRGERLVARIRTLTEGEDPWERVGIAILLA